MAKREKRYGYESHLRKRKAVSVLSMAAVLGVIVAAGALAGPKLVSMAGGHKELRRLWNSGDFEAVYDASQSALESKPLDYFLLTVNGFSAYQLGISQISSPDSLMYIDESINALRKALLLKSSVKDGRVYYVLGKAYSYKGDSFASLAVECLEKARSLSYNAADIPEYLGLAYAASGDHRSAVAAFTEALNPPSGDGDSNALDAGNPADLLLLSIARSYIALEEDNMARAYLVRCIEVSPDVNIITEARLLLGEILWTSGDGDGAESQYLTILDERGENAEARYQLGELYAARGDNARARAEWRLALRADSAHSKARRRLNA